MYSKKVKKEKTSDSEEEYLDIDQDLVYNLQTYESHEQSNHDSTELEEKHEMDVLIYHIVEDIQNIAEFQVLPLAEHLTSEHVKHLFTKLDQI